MGCGWSAADVREGFIEVGWSVSDVREVVCRGCLVYRKREREDSWYVDALSQTCERFFMGAS